ncbi:acyltransferase family protein [Streptomyces sp. NPDC088116]|uniref:acyltransferase family protein n=1 Tax=Streptomyces sp. NPDC088116 TaxID=3365825 RepID=UPI0038065A17
MSLPKTLPALGGMRFVAAILVFTSHIASQPFFRNTDINSTLQMPMDRLGPLAVTFFFMLSGFVLTWAGIPDKSRTTFWRRRAVRVYSLHLPVFLLALVLVVWLQEPTMGRSVWDGALSNLFLVQSWIPDYHEYGSINPVAWSLSCEMLFYATFPFLFAFFSRVREDLLWRWVIGVSVAAMAIPSIGLLLPAHSPLPWDPEMPELRYWFISMFPPVRLLEFVLGILMAQIVMRGRWAGPKPLVCVALFAGTFAVSFLLPARLWPGVLTIPLIALLLGSVAARDVRGTGSWLGTRAMVRLGELTFAFYVIHYLVIQYGHRFLGGDQGYYRQWDTPAAVGLTVLAFAVGLGLAALLHFYVEKPVMRTFGRPRRAPVTDPATQADPVGPAKS